MTADRHDIPDWLIERLALGDLPADRAAELRRRLEAEVGGLDRLAALERSNREILLAHPPREIVPALERRAGRSRRSTLFVLLPALTAFAAVALVVRSGEGPLVADPAIFKGSDTQTRVKGDVSVLRLYRKNGPVQEKLEPGSIVHQADLVQVSYVAMGKRFGVVFSIDGRGGVTLHYPESQGLAQSLLPSGEVALSHAYELDDAPEFERFFIVSSDAPIDLDAVLAGARTLAKKPASAASKYLDLPENVSQYTLTLRKEQP